MKRFGLVCLLAVLAAVTSLLSPARAQIPTQRYASPTGTSGACSAASPCLLQGAINGAIDSTIISCIGGGFSNIENLITNNLTIDCPGAVLTAAAAGFPGLAFNGTSSQVVILRNLTFDGAGQVGTPFIRVTGGATLIIENCKFQNLANSNAIAIQYLPNTVASQLIIRDSAFISNGIAPGTGGGLQVAPAAGGSASVRLERVTFDFNVTAMVLSGPVNATMIGSVVQASRNTGIIVGSGSTLDIDDSKLMYNVGSAVSVSSGGTLRLSNSDVKDNQTGISNSGGHAFTYSNNRIFGNGSTATLTSVQGGQ